MAYQMYKSFLFKSQGILGNVSIQKFNGLTTELNQWTMTGYPLTKFNDIEDFIINANEVVSISKNGILLEGPTVFSANFDIDIDPILDTYLDVTGWGKVCIICIPNRVLFFYQIKCFP